MLNYTVILTPEADGSAITVEVPAMPGVVTWGRDRAEALASAREAIELHLESYCERGEPFPRDRRLAGVDTVTIEVQPPATWQPA